MKKLMTMGLVAGIVATLASCSEDSLNGITTAEAESKSPGSWKVSYYFDNSDGVSHELDAYTFNIAEDGTLTVSGGGATYTGTWVVKNNDDDPNYDTEIDFSIMGNSDMDKIDGSWLMGTINDTKMELLDDSGSEELHLSRQ